MITTECRICKNKDLVSVVDLGNQCLSGVFPEKDAPDPSKSPLELIKCNNSNNDNFCGLLQLKETANLEEMYGSTYGYYSSISPSMVSHLKEKADGLIKFTEPKENEIILDIGCNDGTMLNLFKDSGMKRIGMDPSSEKFKDSFQDDIEVIYDFFSEKPVRQIIGDKECKIITSIAMFYDINDPNSFCKDINKLLEKDGLWIVEFSYFPLLLKNLTYDQINHEHVTYYTLTTFQKIIDKHGLKVIDISFNEINGGSAEVIVSKKGSRYKVNKLKISKVLEEERLINESSYKKFNDRIDNVKKVVQFFLKKSTKKIVGYGASTKGNIILNHCKINSRDIKYICDGNSQKLGLYTPGSNIKIISKEKMRKMKIDYLFVLIWSFRSEVIKQEKKFIRSGGKLIFPLPVFHIVDKENYRQYLKEDLKTFAFNL